MCSIKRRAPVAGDDADWAFAAAAAAVEVEVEARLGDNRTERLGRKRCEASSERIQRPVEYPKWLLP